MVLIPPKMTNQKDTEYKLAYHLEELRKTILHCVIALAILYPVGYLLAPYLINFLISWTLPSQIQTLSFFSPMEVFVLQLKVAFVISFIIGFPYLLFEVWKFILPALYKNEIKFLKTGIILSIILFACGIFMCTYFVLPLIMKFASTFSNNNIIAVLGVTNFITLSGWLMLAFGLMFQFPIFVFLLVKFDIVSIKFLTDKRPYVVVIILIISALLTPPDVLSQILLALPTYFLFESGIILSKLFIKKSN